MSGARTASEAISAPDHPTVTVIVPVRNEEGFLHRSLGSVLAQSYPSDRLEVLVVDGRSEDATREVARALARHHPGIAVRLLDNPGRTAPCALNVGLAAAQGEVVARVDGHCEIAPDYLACGVRHLVEGGYDAVGGPLETVGEGSAAAAAIAVAMSSGFGVGGAPFRTDRSGGRTVDTVAFPLYSRGAIALAGAFDEELVRNQDDEYNYRLRGRGGTVYLAPDVHARYICRSTLRALWRQYFQYGFWKVRVLQKHPRQMQPRQLVPPLFAAALAAGLLAAPWSVLARLALGVTVGSYLLANLAASVWTAGGRGWRHLLRLPAVFAVLHLAYGAGFVVGLVRFARRWGDRRGGEPAVALTEVPPR